MAVVSKQEIRVLSEKFIKIVKYSANTEMFTIELPESVHKKIGPIAEGGTLKEVNDKFSCMIEAFKELKTSKKKVIIIKFAATIQGKSGIDGKYYELEDVGWRHEGAGIEFSCGVFIKHTTKIPNNDDKIDFEWIDVGFPDGFERIKDEWITRNDDYIELPWSKEYEDMLNNLSIAMRTLIFRLLSILESKKTINKFMVSGQKLLTE
jgi:hypothetical protein